MTVPLIVPDASVILKWVLPSDDEPDADLALRLRDAIQDDQVQAWVPALWLYEVGNTITRRFPDQAAPWLTALKHFALEEAPSSPQWLKVAIELTQRFGITFYDAAYHAVALVHQGQLVTADSRYANRASAAGAVVLLNQWMPPDQP
ncbi:MAG: type II toxin-antitoxin system VapC family toxin [Candidatus Competibacteraceae bacterium]|jgi:predicted nucleic acid-binding protein|nr:type II toxin-antitoxin system VapC family toxin [Candidatus Competibacteraceae bacterium]